MAPSTVQGLIDEYAVKWYRNRKHIPKLHFGVTYVLAPVTISWPHFHWEFGYQCVPGSTTYGGIRVCSKMGIVFLQLTKKKMHDLPGLSHHAMPNASLSWWRSSSNQAMTRPVSYTLLLPILVGQSWFLSSRYSTAWGYFEESIAYVYGNHFH